jgi:fatty acid desaturase
VKTHHAVIEDFVFEVFVVGALWFILTLYHPWLLVICPGIPLVMAVLTLISPATRRNDERYYNEQMNGRVRYRDRRAGVNGYSYTVLVFLLVMVGLTLAAFVAVEFIAEW